MPSLKDWFIRAHAVAVELPSGPEAKALRRYTASLVHEARRHGLREPRGCFPAPEADVRAYAQDLGESYVAPTESVAGSPSEARLEARLCDVLRTVTLLNARVGGRP